MLKQATPCERDLPTTVLDLRIGDTYPAVVKCGKPQGVFVYLSPSVQIRIKLSELPESPVDPAEVGSLYPENRLLPAVRIVDVVKGDQPFAEGSIKRAYDVFVTLDVLSNDDIVAAVVKKRLDSGLILTLEHSTVDAFCYVGEIEDTSAEELPTRPKDREKALIERRAAALAKYPVGDRVAARILDIDMDNKRVRVTLKPSAFIGADQIVTLQEKLEAQAAESSCGIHASSGKSDCNVFDARSGSPANSSTGLLENDGASVSEAEDEDPIIDNKAYADFDAAASDNTSSNIHTRHILSYADDQFSDDDDAENHNVSNNQDVLRQSALSILKTIPASDTLKAPELWKTDKKRRRPPALDLDSDSEDVMEEPDAFCSDNDVDDGSGDENSIIGSDDGKHSRSKKRRERRLTVAEKRREELAIRTKEVEDANVDGLKAETALDFERLIVTEPDASGVWIRYIAYYLKLKDLEKAREIANRALERITAQDENERLNVWLAYLNLEAAFGTRETLDHVVRRALQYNDPKRIYWQMTFIHQRQNKVDECIAACKKCVEKYPESKKMWIRYITCLYELSATESTSIDVTVRGILVRGLRRLPQRKHAAVVSTTARLEFKYGSTERGCTYFDKLLAEHPKRTDIWGQYFDALLGAVKSRKMSVTAARAIFEKPTGMTRTFKPRQMKFFFTRWLAFEHTVGSEESQQRVQEEARSYVESVET